MPQVIDGASLVRDLITGAVIPAVGYLVHKAFKNSTNVDRLVDKVEGPEGLTKWKLDVIQQLDDTEKEMMRFEPVIRDAMDKVIGKVQAPISAIDDKLDRLTLTMNNHITQTAERLAVIETTMERRHDERT